MPQVLYTNNAVAALAAPVSTLDSTVTVTNGVVFPSPSGGNYFYLTIDDGSNIEIVKVTARSGDVLTVTRAQQGTTLGSFATSTPVALRVTAGGFEDLYTEINLKLNSSAVSAFGATLIDDADAAAARTTLGLGNLATVTATSFALSILDDADASAVRTTLGLASGATTPISAFGATLVDDVDAATARTTLGLVIGTNVQAYDAGLQSIAGLTTLADRMIYTTASDTYAVTTLTSFARTLLDDADAATMRATLGLSNLSTTTASAYILTLLDDADAATARTTLGLGTAAIQNTGTSGANVPLLNGANTWSDAQTLSSTAPTLVWSESDTSTLGRIQLTGGDLYIQAGAAGAGASGSGDLYFSGWSSTDIGTFQVRHSGAWQNIWHAGNDGAGSGLDADLLDGVQLAALAQLSGATFTGAVVFSSTARTTTGISFGADADAYIYASGTDGISVRVGSSAAYKYFSFNEAGQFYVPTLASAATPDYSWAADPNTGFYSVTGDVIGVSTGGALRFSASTYFYGAATGSASIASAAGTASLPAYTFVGDENTGIYRSGADQLSFATGGTERLRIASNGSLTGYLAAGASTAMTLQGDGNAGVGPSLVLSFTSGGAAPTVGNDIGRIVWNAFDSGLVGETYGYLSCIVNDATAGSEDATFSMTLIENGVRGTKFSVSSAGLGTFSERVRVGNGTAALPAYSTTGDPDTGWYWNSSGIWSYAQNGTARFNISDYFFGATDGGAIKSAAGTAALPALTFVNDTDTGLYPAGANILGFATAGTARFGMTTVFYGSGGTGAPAMTSAAGTVAAPAFTFVTDTDTGLYRVGADNLGISLGGVKYVDLAAGFANFSMPVGSHGTDPNFNLYETDAGADAKRWDIVMSGGTLFFRAVNDAYSSASNWLLVTRSGASPVAATFGIDAVLAATAPTSTLSAGFRGVPVSDRAGNYTLVKADAAYCQNYTGAGGHTLTIPANASVDYPIGTVLTFINTGSGDVSIAITTDTMRLVGSGGTGTRTLAPHGQANAHKITATLWYISGTNLT